ncbi:Serine carboxypeptidase-like 18-like protein [Drosera capensis]
MPFQFRKANGWFSVCFIHLILVTLVVLLIVELLIKTAASGYVVKSLPGFDGDLPFKLETGYVSVNESELFYYFIKSQGHPRRDPLILYLNGGPGCSGLTGFFYQIEIEIGNGVATISALMSAKAGPLAFNLTDYDGGLPTLLSVSYSWTKTANIIFLDAPVGTGFSYSNSSSAYNVSDTASTNQTYQFLRKWLKNHTAYLSNPLLIGGDSYSGLLVPIIVEKIVEGNKDGLKPRMNIKGYLISSPHEDSVLEINSRIPYAHQLSLISKDLYMSAKANCNGSYADVELSEAKCVEDLYAINECLDDLNAANILLPKCSSFAMKADEDFSRRVLKQNQNQILIPLLQSDEYFCPNFMFMLSAAWANNRSVQQALNIREGTIKEWVRCNATLVQKSYTFDVNGSFDYHKNLTATELQVLVFSGDHDLITPHTATEEWIRDLNLPVSSKWRPWLVDGQIAGYTTKYSTLKKYRLTYATVKASSFASALAFSPLHLRMGAGHSPHEYKRRDCYEMFDRWVHFYPL